MYMYVCIYPLCQYQKCVGDGTPDERRFICIHVCVCVCVCVCIYMYICIYTSTKHALVTALRTSAGLYVYICIYVCVCMYVCVCVYVYMYIYVCIYIYQ